LVERMNHMLYAIVAKRRAGLAWAWVLVGLMGCARAPSTDPPSVTERSLGDGFPVYTPPPVPENAGMPGSGLVAPAGHITLNDALAAALLNNADLRAFAWDVRRAQARRLQQQLWPNPELEIEMEEVARTSAGNILDSAELVVRLSQPVLTAGKLGKRVRVAALDSDLAAWEFEAKRIDVLTQVVQRYSAVLAAQRRLEVAQGMHRLAEQVYQVVSKQVSAGAVSPIQETRAGVEVSTTRLDLQQATRSLKTARQRLAALWGGTTARFTEARGDLEQSIQAIPPLKMLAQHLPQNPEVVRWTTAIARQRAQLELAEAQIWPDVTVQAGVQYFNETDDPAGTFALSLPLPLFNRHQGTILEAHYELSKAVVEQQGAATRVRSDLARAYQQLHTACIEVDTLKGETLPRAESAYHSVRTAYNQGKVELLDVLDAQRTLFQIENRYVTALVDYHQAAAEVERLIGQTLESIGRAQRPPERTRSRDERSSQ
jgi:cobalt-zinc-cadmium efflux system outer membrane protein